ncbi:hypothetical protein DB88DRAFT_540774 [Papiliotrema laurentii]|uniref:rRNA biogenesis protein RRP36 n=1 Tax=Papiliotrema laurentii TaxID=5418 RepID=A0AAD9D264_PAPLA|nr:hypothetical protein DB88DRAFT_540774 [Papiliotrema laurentii]
MSSDSEFSDDDILYTDSEVDEFALEEQGSGAAQWEPDAWDAEDSEDEDSLSRSLATIPLKTLAKARKSMGNVSRYQQGESSSTAQSGTPVKKATTSARAVEGRDSKNAPTAMSSKKQVSRIRQVVDLPKISRRDPRFSSVSAGGVDMHLHGKSYGFIPELLKEEYAKLKKDLAAASKAERTCARVDKESWAEERARLERLLAQTRTRLERTEREAREREVLAKAKKEEREKREGGKGAWYMKKAAKRDLLLKSKFEALEDKGGKLAVKKAMDKKRKKIAGKEKKSRPM